MGAWLLGASRTSRPGWSQRASSVASRSARRTTPTANCAASAARRGRRAWAFDGDVVRRDAVEAAAAGDDVLRPLDDLRGVVGQGAGSTKARAPCSTSWRRVEFAEVVLSTPWSRPRRCTASATSAPRATTPATSGRAATRWTRRPSTTRRSATVSTCRLWSRRSLSEALADEAAGVEDERAQAVLRDGLLGAVRGREAFETCDQTLRGGHSTGACQLGSFF